jgi:hypothetical protein
MVKQAMIALKAGRREEARDLLLNAVDQDEHHEQAWLWLSAVVDSLEEQQICLENVLAINPQNERARKGLDGVNQKLSAQSKPASPRPASPPSEPAPSLADDDDWLSRAAASASLAGTPPPPSSPPAQTSDNWFSASAPRTDAADAQPFDDWLATTAAQAPQADAEQGNAPFGNWAAAPSTATPDSSPDSFAPASSVDWDRTGAPAAYGSGKQVDMPSPQEYDDWVQSLNLGGAPPAPGNPSPFLTDGLAPFGDTSFMVDSGPFGATGTSALPDSPFAADVSPWDDEAPFFQDESVMVRRDQPSLAEEREALFGAPMFDAVEDAEPEGDPFGANPFPFEDEAEPGPLTDSGWINQRLGDAARTGTSVFAPSTPPQKTLNAQDYFQYIPADIEPKASGIDSRSVMILGGIIVLVILNLISFGYLISAL